MTREESIKFAKEIAAFQQGKTIQVYTRKWVDDPNPSFSIKSKYRVKPEQQKRLPTIDDVKQWFMENRVFKDKTGSLMRIQKIDIDNCPITIDDDFYTIEQFIEYYTHADGSELYITE